MKDTWCEVDLGGDVMLGKQNNLYFGIARFIRRDLPEKMASQRRVEIQFLDIEALLRASDSAA